MLTFDDNYRLEDFNLIALPDHEHPMTPIIENKTMFIPGRIGLWDFGSEIKEKRLNVPIGLVDYDANNLQQKLNEFSSFITDDYGKPREVKVIFDYEPDKFYKVKLSTDINPQRLINHSIFNLSFVANDPHKYSNVLAEEVLWGSEVITFEYHYLLGHEGYNGMHEIRGPQTINVPVEGLAVQPIFEIQGTANNLTVSANGHSFSLPNFSNTRWEIDFEKYLVFRNGQETMIEIRDFYLLPGNNQVRIEGNNINVNMRIKYRDKYN